MAGVRLKSCFRKMKRHAVRLLALWLLVLQGCVFQGGKSVAGKPIFPDREQVIKTGLTTRGEIIQRFGAPEAIFDELRVVIYEWKESRSWWWMIVGQGGGRAGEFTTEKAFVCLFAFDREDRLIKVGARKINRGRTLRSAAFQFAGEPMSTTFVARAIPRGQSLVYVFRPVGADRPGIVVIPQHIYLDGKLLATLERRTSTWSEVAPGRHEISVPDLYDPKKRKVFPVDLKADQTLFVELKIERAGIFLKQVFAARPESEAMPHLQKLKVRW